MCPTCSLLLGNDVVSQLPSCVSVTLQQLINDLCWHQQDGDGTEGTARRSTGLQLEPGLCLDLTQSFGDVACLARITSSCERVSYRGCSHQAVRPPGCTEALALSQQREGCRRIYHLCADLGFLVAHLL